MLLWEGSRLRGLAVCHIGAGSEAGSGVCYVKVGAVRSGIKAQEDFARLLEACESLARRRGASSILAGMNTARHEAYRYMLGRGFKTAIQGVIMERNNAEGYNRPGVWLIDDWR